MIFKLQTPPGKERVTFNKVNSWGQTVGKVTVSQGAIATLYRELGYGDPRVVANRGHKVGEFLLSDGSVVTGIMSPDWLGRAPLHLWTEA